MKKIITSALFTLIVLAALLAGSNAALAQGNARTVKEPKKITAKVKIQNKGKIALGDKVTLKATVKGVKNVEHEIKWQVKVDGEWKDIEGETHAAYSFTVTEDNANCEWRVAVVTE